MELSFRHGVMYSVCSIHVTLDSSMPLTTILFRSCISMTLAVLVGIYEEEGVGVSKTFE